MRISLCAFVAILATVCNVTRADELGSPIDLSGLSEIESALEEPIDDGSEATSITFDPSGGYHRFYVTGIVGASFATLSPSRNPGNQYGVEELNDTSGTLFNGGGAIGVAFSRSSGQLRMEFEQRLRGPMYGTQSQPSRTGSSGFFAAQNVYTDNAWSSLVNLWRDYYVSDRFGLYCGGGIGLGGYRSTFSSPPEGTPVYDQYLTVAGAQSIATWAWQVGTGVTYRFTNRVTVDVGYRFFATAPAVNNYTLFVPDTVSPNVFPFPVSHSSSFSASELLLSIRIYEPFRGWR